MAIDFNKLENEIASRGKTEVLDNGVTIISENIPGCGLVSGSMDILAGANYESDKDYGVMHFLEHVCYGESRSYPDMHERNMYSALLGMKINATTSGFQIIFPVSGDNPYGFMMQPEFIKGFNLVYDLAFHPSFMASSIDRERDVVLREIAEMDYNNNRTSLYTIQKTIQDRLYSNNKNLMRDNLGTKETVSSITAETLKEYHSRFFVGNNLLVKIIGDLDGSSDVLAEVKKTLQDIPAGKKAQKPKVLPETPYDSVEHMDFAEEKNRTCDLQVFFQIPPHHSRYNPTISVMNYILGNGVNSILHRNVRESKRLSYSIGSNIEGSDLTGFLKISCKTDIQYTRQSLQAIEECIDDLKKGDFNPLMIDAAKASMVPHMLSKTMVPGWINSVLEGRYYAEMWERETTFLETIKSIFQVSKEDVVEAANLYLGKDRLVARF